MNFYEQASTGRIKNRKKEGMKKSGVRSTPSQTHFAFFLGAGLTCRRLLREQ